MYFVNDIVMSSIHLFKVYKFFKFVEYYGFLVSGGTYY